MSADSARYFLRLRPPDLFDFINSFAMCLHGSVYLKFALATEFDIINSASDFFFTIVA